jgi:hypothetical protein
MATLVLVQTEICPDCGREWPHRFGRHNCNFSRRYVHNNARVIQPGAALLASVRCLSERLQDETMRSAEYAHLAGEGDPYGDTLRDIDATIGYLKHFRREMQALAGHEHRWNEDDYCSICGADGRA